MTGNNYRLTFRLAAIPSIFAIFMLLYYVVGRCRLTLCTTGLRPLCRKTQTIRQSKWPASYGASTEIWYRQRHLVTLPTGFGSVKVGSTLGTGRPKRHFLTTQGPESRSA